MVILVAIIGLCIFVGEYLFGWDPFGDHDKK